MKQRIMCLLLFLLVSGVYIWTNDKLSFFFLIAMVVCVLFVVISNQIAAKRLETECITKRNVEQSNGVIIISLHNRTMFPMFRIQIQLAVMNLLTDSLVQVERSCMLLPFERREEKIYIDSMYCGKVETDVKELKCTDGFGLSSYRGKAVSKGNYYCYPLLQDVNLDVVWQQHMHNMVAENYLHRRGNDPTEVLDIRDYQRGDSIKMIHWKLSHKHGKKLVRELDMPSNQDTLLVFGLQSEATEERIHKLVEYVLSLSQTLLKEDIHHDALLLDSNGVLIRFWSIDGEEGYSSYEKRILNGGITTSGELLDLYMVQKDVAHRYSSVFYVTENDMTGNLTADNIVYMQLPNSYE